MGKETGIPWTDHTWNPWRGCHKISAGCKNCYMFREQSRYGNDPNVVVRASFKTFNAPLSWKEPARVFTCSWSDFFLPEADEWRNEAWEIIRKTSQLTYQILTKRPENIAARLPRDWGNGYPNVWLGVTTENQEMADRRIPLLFEIPAVIRFVSCEPLLGRLDGSFVAFLDGAWSNDDALPLLDFAIDWVICGGESGVGFREMNLDWARSLRDQCVETDTPFFFKQTSGIHPDKSSELDGKIWREFPNGRLSS